MQLQVHVVSQHHPNVPVWPEILSPASQKSVLAEVHLCIAQLPSELAHIHLAQGPGRASLCLLA